MTEHITALQDLRDLVVERRRRAVLDGDVEAAVLAQQQVAIIDEAIADERALGQALKDEQAMGRALKRADQGDAEIADVSIMSDPIKVQD